MASFPIAAADGGAVALLRRLATIEAAGATPLLLLPPDCFNAATERGGGAFDGVLLVATIAGVAVVLFSAEREEPPLGDELPLLLAAVAALPLMGEVRLELGLLELGAPPPAALPFDATKEVLLFTFWEVFAMSPPFCC